MPKSRTVKLVEQLQQAAEQDAIELMEFHAGHLADLESLNRELHEKAKQDAERLQDLMNQVGGLKRQADEITLEITRIRDSEHTAVQQIIEWTESAITATRARLDADAGERQPASAVNVTKLRAAATPAADEAGAEPAIAAE